MKRAILAVAAVSLSALLVVLLARALRNDPQPPPVPTATDQTALHPTPTASAPPAESVRPRHESAAFALVEDMKVGWNLGNALDSLDHQKNGIRTSLKTATPEEFYETLWGNPVTTTKTIADVAAMGFGAVRVPVTWQDHMDDDDTIAPAWLARVQQVVDDVLANGMYCIINLHHDVGSGTWPWLKADPEGLDDHKEKLCKVWAQISAYFQDYGDHLLFEGFNEILDTDDRWTDSTVACYDAVNELNQVFVDTVRATGGRNANRFLIVNPYAASVDSGVLSHYRLPMDTVADRLIAGVHTYAPAGFSWPADMATWTQTYAVWDEERGGPEIKAMLRSVRANLVDRGIPVIISECGAWNKNNAADRSAYAAFLAREAAKNSIACFWWDGGGTAEIPEEVNGATLYNRYHEAWLFPEVANAFVQAADEAWGE